MNYIFSNLQNKSIYLYRFMFFIIVINIIISVILYYFNSDKIIYYKILLVVELWTLLVYVVPLLILYFNYSKMNGESVLKVFDNKISYKVNSKVVEVSLLDIEYIELNLSVPLYNNRFRLFFWDEYFYALVKLKDGSIFYVTCLLCDNLEKVLPNTLIKKKERIFPVIN